MDWMRRGAIRWLAWAVMSGWVSIPTTLAQNPVLPEDMVQSPELGLALRLPDGWSRASELSATNALAFTRQGLDPEGQSGLLRIELMDADVALGRYDAYYEAIQRQRQVLLRRSGIKVSGHYGWCLVWKSAPRRDDPTPPTVHFYYLLEKTWDSMVAIHCQVPLAMQSDTGIMLDGLIKSFVF